MHRMIPFVTAVFLVACGGSTAADTDSSSDSDSTPDSDAELACTDLSSGDWTGSGAAFGMSMGVQLDMVVDTCSFELTDWSMNMGSLPDGGTVAGDEVTLSSQGDDYWATCVGTADSEGEVNGVCSDDGAAFKLKAD